MLPKNFVEVLSSWKVWSSFWMSLFTPDYGQMRQSPCFILNIFTIWTEWVTSPNACVIYPNSMIYLPVHFHALCPVLSRFILSSNTKCLIIIDWLMNNCEFFFQLMVWWLNCSWGNTFVPFFKMFKTAADILD